MEAIKDTIINVIRDLSDKKGPLFEDDVLLCLKKALTKKELRHIKVNYFRKGILGIVVDSSSWLYSLSLKKEMLLTRLGPLNKTVKDIRFYIGEIN